MEAGLGTIYNVKNRLIEKRIRLLVWLPSFPFFRTIQGLVKRTKVDLCTT